MTITLLVLKSLNAVGLYSTFFFDLFQAKPQLCQEIPDRNERPDLFFRSCGEENKIMCQELSKSHSTHLNFSSPPLSLQPEVKAVTERPRVKHLCNLQKRESRSDRSYLQL